MHSAPRHASRQTIQYAHDLRKEMPKAERVLWKMLRELPSELAPRFRRQHPIGNYIVDFVCTKCKLIVELDGDSHDARQAYDAKRDLELAQKGYKILRFSNAQLYENATGVVESILLEIGKDWGRLLLRPHPNPPPKEGGGD